MASHARLESSLRRSARLGREVLERATRRAVDWTNPGASQTTDNQADIPVRRTRTELADVFATMADLMVQMSHQCQSGCCTEPSDAERKHASRFHTQPPAGHRLTPSDEDFIIDVLPGTYAVTASVQESQQQTQVVTVKPGESFHLTFNL
uniref:Uncharacterized protein n=1 Tax=Mola mola TaxID=94237 RepID=A0A3Q3W639_MOLML